MMLQAEPQLERQGEAGPQTTWYAKPLPTVSDTLTPGRRALA